MTNQTAGIVCYTIDQNRLYLLLGREQYVAGWLCSHQWSEPGGHAKKTDQRDIKRTAVREFHEESLGILPHITVDTMTERQYTAKLQIHRQNRRKRGKTYFLVHEPRRHEVETEFHVRREQLRGIQYTVQRLQNIQKQLLAAGAPVPETPRRVFDRLQVVQDIVSFQEMSDHTCRVEIKCICPTELVYFRYPRPNESCIITQVYVDVPLDLSALYIRLLSLKQLLEKQLVALPTFLRTNAIAPPKQPGWLPTVRREYLEKDRLCWFDALELLQNVGQGWCRPGFEVPLQLMINYLANGSAAQNSNCTVSRPVSPVECALADPAGPF
jgi:hypothetical protein